MKYRKVRFFSPEHGATAGIVLPAEKVKHSTIPELSDYFPMFEAMKMQRLELSPEFDSFDAAFFYEF